MIPVKLTNSDGIDNGNDDVIMIPVTIIIVMILIMIMTMG